MHSLTGTIVDRDGMYWVVDTEDAPRYLSRLFIDPPSCNIPVAVGMRVKLKYVMTRSSGLWRIVAERPQK